MCADALFFAFLMIAVLFGLAVIVLLGMVDDLDTQTLRLRIELLEMREDLADLMEHLGVDTDEVEADDEDAE